MSHSSLLYTEALEASATFVLLLSTLNVSLSWAAFGCKKDKEVRLWLCRLSQSEAATQGYISFYSTNDQKQNLVLQIKYKKAMKNWSHGKRYALNYCGWVSPAVYFLLSTNISVLFWSASPFLLFSCVLPVFKSWINWIFNGALCQTYDPWHEVTLLQHSDHNYFQ